MENDILDSLDDLGYPGDLHAAGALKQWVEGGPSLPAFTTVVEWLTKELQVLLKLEETVNAIKSSEDVASFLLELSAFLKEIGCPHKCLIEGPANQKLNTVQSRYILLDYLCTELQAARMLELQKSSDNKMKVEMKESPTARYLREMLKALVFSKPPATVTAKDLFSKVESKVQQVVQEQKPTKIVAETVGKPLFVGVLNPKQWESLDVLQQQMHKEYTVRKELLLLRLDVTIQSFKWGDRLKKKADEIGRTYDENRRGMTVEPDVQVANILAAREEIAIIEKTSSARLLKNTQCDVKKVKIGMVPDRGGRPQDQRPPPPEMPSWQKRKDGPGGGGGGFGGGGFGGGGGGGRGGGNRVQDKWSDQRGANAGYDKNNHQQGLQQQNYQGNYHQQQQNHQGNFHQQQQNHQGNYHQQQTYQPNYQQQQNYQPNFHQQPVFQPEYQQSYQQTYNKPYQDQACYQAQQHQNYQQQVMYQQQQQQQSYQHGYQEQSQGQSRGGRGRGGGHRGGRGGRGGRGRGGYDQGY